MPNEAQNTPPSTQNPYGVDALSRNEVASVNTDDRAYYVSDMPSPYLSARQAQEDVQATKRRHSTIVAVVVGILLLAVLGGAGYFLWTVLNPNAGAAVPKFETATIERGEYVESINATALVQPVDERVVVPGISGKITQILVREGDAVNEGDTLFVLENAGITESIASAQKVLDTVKADAETKLKALDEANMAVLNAQVALQDANNDAERIVAQAALDAAQTHAHTAQADFDAANISLQTVQQTYDQAKSQLDALTIHAPIAGVVSSMGRDATFTASVGGATQLCTISNTNSYRVRIEIPAEKRDRVSEGQEVLLNFPALDNLTVGNHISSIEDSDSLHVANVIIEEPDERLTTGTAVATAIIVQRIPDSLMVPNDALTRAEDGSAHLDVLLDPSRGIHSDVPVTVIAQDGTHAAIEASNIQVGNNVILHSEDAQE